MHTVFFGLKRAHHSVLRISRDALAKMGLTAARFDMLYAVKTHGGDMRQSTLRRWLGVGRTTVSRMLASLEELGLVARRGHWHDRRQKVVRLTTLGSKRIDFAHRRFTRSGWAQLAIDTALCGDHQSDRWCDPGQCIVATSTIDGMLKHLRRAFWDRATLYYPWGPGDSDDPWEDILEQDYGAGAPPPESRDAVS
jgi:DNA-binding MarR family transcriptional regulator